MSGTNGHSDNNGNKKINLLVLANQEKGVVEISHKDFIPEKLFENGTLTIDSGYFEMAKSEYLKRIGKKRTKTVGDRGDK